MLVDASRKVPILSEYVAEFEVDTSMTLNTAGITSQDSIVVSTEGRSTYKDIYGQKQQRHDLIKYYEFSANIIVLAAGLGIASDFAVFMAYLSRIYTKSSPQSLSLRDTARFIGSHSSAYWHYPERGNIYFDLIVAGYKDKPELYMWEQKTKGSLTAHLLPKEQTKKFICNGLYAQATDMFDKFYKLKYPTEAELLALSRQAMTTTNKTHSNDVGGITRSLRIDSSGIHEVDCYYLA